VALTKPIIVIKPGRTEAAAKAAASHTGSLTGSDEVLQAAFQRVGVLRVDTISELFDMAEVLAKQPRPKGPRLTIVTNAGGPSVIATDMLITSGAQLADLTPETMAAFNKILPTTWSHNNPVDIIGDAKPELYAQAVDIAAKDPNTDGLLVILTPQAMTDPTATAECLKPYAHIEGKPIIASWMGAGQVEKGEDILNAANIPTFKYPDRAAKAFYYMWRYSENLRSLYETPSMPAQNGHGYIDHAQAEKIISDVRKTGRTILTEFESKNLLSAYGIPTVETQIARTENDAVKLAARLGFPVVLKLYSETITHKTDVGGVQLNLRTASAVRRAWKTIEASVAKKVGAEHFLGVTVQKMIRLEGYELIIGSSVDPQFGPVLLFGTGGQLVEVFKDRSLGLPPLNATLARRMMERTKIFTALKGVRGRKSADIPALEQLLVRFSQLVVEQPWIAEIDINPLLVTSERIYALDARVVLHDPKTPEAKLPRPAIRPYPMQYVTPWKMKNRTPLVIRPIRPEDEPLMVKFHETLSEESVYSRYFSGLKLSQRVAHERLTRICFNDYDREIALVAELKPAKKDEASKILGVGRLSKLPEANEGEFAVLVSDAWHGQGLGFELLKRLIEIGRVEKLAKISGQMLAENQAMHHVCRKAGFQVIHDSDGNLFTASYTY
jgi:acetyltransferase